MNKNLLAAIATLVGTTIGAGILGIPYVIAKAGFLTGLFVIIVIGLSILFVNLALGEIILRTPGNHQLTGYASIYYGKTGKYILTFAMVFGIYGALTAYLIGEGTALSYIFNGNITFFTLIFFAIASLILLFGLKAIEKSEVLFASVTLFLILIIVMVSFNFIIFDNLKTFDIKNVLIPYGVIFFAFLAIPAIPEMKEELIRNKKLLKKAIVIGSLIPFLAYVLFALVVVGVSGDKTSEIATIGLGKFLGEKTLIIGNLFAIFSMAAAFLGLGFALMEMYHRDYKINKNLSWFLTCFVPLGLVMLGINNFIGTISLVGSLVAGIDGILIISMWLKAKKFGKRKPEYSINLPPILIMIAILVFLLALYLSFVNFSRIII